MDRTSKILLGLIFWVLIATLFRPLFFPGQARADEPYQVASVLRSEFRVVTKKLMDRVEEVDRKFDKHTHKLEVCSCEEGVAKIKVTTSKP